MSFSARCKMEFDYWKRLTECRAIVKDICSDINKVDVSFESNKGVLPVCKNGAGVEFSEEKAKEVLLEEEIEILVSLGDGDGKSTAWGCDLTYDYVKINGDYRT